VAAFQVRIERRNALVYPTTRELNEPVRWRRDSCKKAFATRGLCHWYKVPTKKKPLANGKRPSRNGGRVLSKQISEAILEELSRAERPQNLRADDLDDPESQEFEDSLARLNFPQFGRRWQDLREEIASKFDFAKSDIGSLVPGIAWMHEGALPAIGIVPLLRKLGAPVSGIEIFNNLIFQDRDEQGGNVTRRGRISDCVIALLETGAIEIVSWNSIQNSLAFGPVFRLRKSSEPNTAARHSPEVAQTILNVEKVIMRDLIISRGSTLVNRSAVNSSFNAPIASPAKCADETRRIWKRALAWFRDNIIAKVVASLFVAVLIFWSTGIWTWVKKYRGLE
jgi:hypothetical protein